ncbi:MAG: ComEA family DNA-binding protein [Thermodesulfobacteriota bacterium]
MRKQNLNNAASGALFLFFLLVSAHFLVRGSSLVPAQQPLPLARVFVRIHGDVSDPGVYGFDHVPSLSQVLQCAGDIKGNTGGPALLEAEPLHAGCQVVLESENGRISLEVGKMTAYQRVTLGIPLSLNQEAAEGFTAVPGIGPATARAIVRERTRQGGFEKMDDVLSVRGIGPVMRKKIADYCTL